MGGGATKPAATPTAAAEAQHLVNEIDNSNSVLHLNVHTWYYCSLAYVVRIWAACVVGAAPAAKQ